jgi:DNA-binding protein H-NS
MFGKRQKAPPKIVQQEVSKDHASLGFDQLIEMKQALDREIASRKETEIEALRSRATATAAALGIPLPELFGIQLPPAAEPQRRKVRRTPRAQYRDPENPDNTWSGRGKPPKWMLEKLEHGADKEAFLIQ